MTITVPTNRAEAMTVTATPKPAAGNTALDYVEQSYSIKNVFTGEIAAWTEDIVAATNYVGTFTLSVSDIVMTSDALIYATTPPPVQIANSDNWSTWGDASMIISTPIAGNPLVLVVENYTDELDAMKHYALGLTAGSIIDKWGNTNVATAVIANTLTAGLGVVFQPVENLPYITEVYRGGSLNGDDITTIEVDGATVYNDNRTNQKLLFIP